MATSGCVCSCPAPVCFCRSSSSCCFLLLLASTNQKIAATRTKHPMGAATFAASPFPLLASRPPVDSPLTSGTETP